MDNNLTLQIIVVLLSMLVFAVILEGFGYALQKIISPILRRMDGALPTNEGTVVRIFIGGLFYTLVFLALGEARLITKAIVLSVSLAVPVLAFIFGRRWKELRPAHARSIFNANKYIILGSAAFGLLTFIFWFRPITGFDALWYHLTIPKLFLQNHDVQNQGQLLRYSLQPSMDYFWNLWPLSLGIPTAVASIIINSFQALMVCMGLGFASKIGKGTWGWGKSHQFFVPILLGFTFEGVALLGGGGNDLLGLAYGLVATLYCFHILTKPKVSWTQLTYGLLLIVGLATIKAFFTIYACMVLVYLLAGVWDKLPGTSKSRKHLLKLACLLLVIFTVTYLPWLVRSYAATGRLLDPIGAPGFNVSLYADSGGGTAVNHWTKYVFTRFYSLIGQMLFFVYSPLIVVGILSVFNKTIRKKATNLWLLSFVGFCIVFFASIALQWRYYLPEATLLIFLGIATLIELNKSFDLFGRLVVGVVLAIIVTTIGLRVFYTTESTGAETLTDVGTQRISYIRHFTSTNHYLNATVSPTYTYVQERGPEGLLPNEKIFVAYTFKPSPLFHRPDSRYDLSGIHNMAYINNPVLEMTMDPKSFENIKNTDQLVAALRSNHIRYILSRSNMGQICQYVGVQNYQSCDSPTIFKEILVDDAWGVTWYELVNS